MFCSDCKQNFNTKAHLLLHRAAGVCRKDTGTNIFNSLKNPEQDSEIESPADDSDADPSYQIETDEKDNYGLSPQSSPLTEQQQVDADEAECMLMEIEDYSDKKIADTKRKSKSDAEKYNLLKPKLLKLEQQIAMFKEKRKIAFKEGKIRMAKKMKKKIEKVKQILVLENCEGNNLQELEADPLECITNNNNKLEKPQRKKNYCIYCDKLVSKFCEHVEKRHKDSPEGVALRSVTGSRATKKIEKTKITDAMRKKWNSIYNSKNPNKKIVVKKRKVETDVGNIVCRHCSGLYRRDKLSVHIKKCAQFKLISGNSKIDTNIKAIKDHSTVEVPYKNWVTDEFKKEILNGIRMDEVMNTAVHDKTIMYFGNEFHASRREKSAKDYVIREIRDLTRLFMETKKLNPSIQCFDDALNPAYFEDVVKAALNMAGYDQKTGIVTVPSVAYRLSQPISDCVHLLKTREIASIYKNLTKDRSKLTRYEDFLEQMKNDWKKKIGRICRKAQKFAKAGKIQIIADEADITKLAAYIESSYKKLIRHLKEHKDKKTFDMLTHSLVTHIMLLVRRRPVDFKLANLRHYLNVDRNDELLQLAENKFTKEELDTCKQFNIFYVPGKNIDVVPIVLTPTMRNVFDVIIEHRHCVDITSDTLFVLSDDRQIQPTHSIKILKQQVTLKKPRHLTGNGLRHQAATFSRLHSTHPQYQDFLASFLGHTLHIHKKNYELPVGIIQKLMVCPILHNIMKGKNTSGTKEADQDSPKQADSPKQCGNPDDEENKECLDLLITNKRKCIQSKDEDLDFEIDVCPQSSSSEDDANVYTTPKKHNKSKWSEQEQDTVLLYFSEAILNKVPPKRSEVKKFLSENPTISKNRSIDQVYLYVRNHALRRQQDVTPRVKKILSKFK